MQGQCKPNAIELARIAEVQPVLADFIGKVTAIFFRFQKKSRILLKHVWTNVLFMDKSRKQAKKLSKVSLENSNLFGLFFNCDFAGSLEIEDEYPDKSTKSESIKINDIEDYGKYDVGVVGGIGLWMNHWNLELNYQRGLATMDKKGKSLYSNRLLLTLGYAF